ncbi:MAG: EVE domain-containing protein [Proteobacteria bacterium]|nr:EVE domain-containing protein [Pseudomonadota bacterium]NBX86530.1 EVE domain-containing protein [Pseudomonadota bacterium]
MAYWLMKSEPEVYGWESLVSEKIGVWDGVRNYSARNNLRAMKKGDDAFFYHSNAGKLTGVVGVVRVVGEAEPDITFGPPPHPWVVVKVAPVVKFKRLVSLAEIRAEPRLQKMELMRYGRLSVQKVLMAEWRIIWAMGQQKTG